MGARGRPGVGLPRSSAWLTGRPRPEGARAVRAGRPSVRSRGREPGWVGRDRRPDQRVGIGLGRAHRAAQPAVVPDEQDVLQHRPEGQVGVEDVGGAPFEVLGALVVQPSEGQQHGVEQGTPTQAVAPGRSLLDDGKEGSPGARAQRARVEHRLAQTQEEVEAVGVVEPVRRAGAGIGTGGVHGALGRTSQRAGANGPRHRPGSG